MRKAFERIASVFLVFIILITIVSCGKEKWNFDKSDVANFVGLSTEINKQGNESYKVELTSSEEIFKGNISKSDILFFDRAELKNVVGYISYKDIKGHTIKVSNISVADSKNSVSFTFNGEESNNYGVIIHKSALKVDNYAMGYVNNITTSKTITEYEEQLISTKGKWSDAEKVVQMGNYISQTVLSVLTDNPVSYSGGLFGIVTTLGSAFLSSGPSLDSVAKQLDVIDGKIDAISSQIDANQKQLLDELVRTQAMIDEVKVIQYNQNITAYQTDYVKPIEDYLLIYKDSVEQALKKYVNEERLVKVYYGETEDDSHDLIFASEQSVSDAYFVDFTISDFSNAKAYLKKNKDIVGDGFAKELNKDILVALDGVELPYGRTKDVIAEDIYKTLVDNLNQEVLSKDDETLHRDVLQLLSNFTAFANAIAGTNFESVINSYISRLEYIYNFHGEISGVIRDLLASIKISLDYYLSISQTACLAQKINYAEELYQAYSAAADYIKSIYESHNTIKDNYSYCIKNNVKSNLFNTAAEVYFTSLGNSPVFHSSFKLRSNINYDGGTFTYDEKDVNELNIVDYTSVKALATRYEMIRGLGQTNKGTFIEYLIDRNIIQNSEYETLKRLFNGGRTVDGSGKILTSYSVRDLNNSDNVELTCSCYGNPNSYYFHVSYIYNYRYSSGKPSAEYWSGKMAYGDIIDGKTGKLDDNKVVSAFAKYAESHFYWIDDEYWGFVDEHFGNFYFMLLV